VIFEQKNIPVRENFMKKTLLLALLASLCLAGCQPANIIASKWDTGLSGENAQTRCEEVDMRSKSEMDAAFAKYDGWKLIYISEYTTGHKIGTHAAVCFERKK
jgi:hypothetical protein